LQHLLSLEEKLHLQEEVMSFIEPPNKSAKVDKFSAQSLWLPNSHWCQEISHSQIRIRHLYKKE